MRTVALDSEPSWLRDEKQLLQRVCISLVSVTDLMGKLVKSVENDDKDLGVSVLRSLYNGPSKGGIALSFKKGFDDIRHRIEAVASPRTIHGLVLDFGEEHDGLTAYLKRYNSNSVLSAHEAVIKLFRDVPYTFCQCLSPEDDDVTVAKLLHTFSDHRWEVAKSSLVFLKKHDFEELAASIKRESSAAIDYVSNSSSGLSAGASNAGKENETPPTGLEALTKAPKQAWASWKLAEDDHAELPTDDQAYDWLREQPDDLFIGELVDYTMPDRATWKRYVRLARREMNENKNLPRTGRDQKSGSIVKSSDL